LGNLWSGRAGNIRICVGQSDGFAYIKERLGLTECRASSLGSPFNYGEQAELHLVPDMPDPSHTAEFIPAACVEFVTRYGQMVLALAAACGLSPEDRDDVRQEVMMAAIDALREHRYEREQGHFKPWFKSIVYHKIQKARAVRAPRAIPSAAIPPDTPRGITGPAPHAVEVIDPHPDPAQQFEADFEAEWQKVAFEEALDEVRREVDPLTYQAFDLYARKDRPPREVAKLLGLSRNAVYIAKTRILTRLREKVLGSSNASP
jgi:RNA polymerase sigma-70 factor (ECF subfamily)